MVAFSKRPGRLPPHCILIVTLILFFYSSADALTRWSAVRLVPHADMLEGGAIVIDAHTYMFSDIIDGTTVKPVGMVEFGLSEWINIEAGYTGGFNLGFKVRILGETRPLMPSLAMGARNFFSHREAYYYGYAADTLDNEIYLVLGKSVEAARLRFHVGLQSIPKNEQERFSPFAVIEKYFGMGLYATAEVHRRAETFCPSLFVDWRFLKQRLEVSAGVVDITGMFMSDGVPPGSPFFTSSDSRFVRPGIWMGLRFKGGLKFGKNEGLTGVETRLSAHSTSISALRGEVDSLKALLRGSSQSMADISRSLRRITDSTLTDDQRFKSLAGDRLAVLKSLYEGEPFEPEAVKKAMAELIANRDRMLPALYEIVLDPVRENKIRTLAVTAIGEIGTQAAADVVIELLGQSPNPEMTIECLIALGKMKETRAVYLMQQLSNDPNDDVAFTAAEVLQKIEKETGVSATPVPVKAPPESIPEKNIGNTAPKEAVVKRPLPAAKPVEPLKRPPPAAGSKADSGLQKVEKPEFTEATVTKAAAGPGVNQSPQTVVRPAEKQAPAAEKKTAVPAPAQSPATASEPIPVAETDTAAVPSSIEKKGVGAKESVPPPVTAKAAAAPAAPKPAKAGEKTAPVRKRIDTSKETW